MDYELKFMVWPLRLYIANFYIAEPIEVVFEGGDSFDFLAYVSEFSETDCKILSRGCPISFEKQFGNELINKGIARLATQEELYQWTKRGV